VCAFRSISKQWTLNEGIKNKFGDSDITKAFCTIADFSSNPYNFWAEKMHDAMKGFSTNDEKLIRVVVSRCEIDLMNVVQVFGERFGAGKTLKNWIESETSGDYRTLLLLVCGFNDSTVRRD